MVTWLTGEFYDEIEAQALRRLRECQEDVGFMAEIREKHSDDWEVEELTSSIIFEDLQIIQDSRREIENARKARSTNL